MWFCSVPLRCRPSLTLLPHPSFPLPRRRGRTGTGTIGRRGFWQGNNRISKRLDAHKNSDPFARAGKQKTSFAVVYSSGGIPCRLDHGAVKCRLRWDRAPAELAYDPLLVTVAEGLSETKHPYVFIARAAFAELLAAPGGAGKAAPLAPRLVRPLRKAMLCRADGVFAAALDAVQQLSAAVGPALNGSLKELLIQIAKKAFVAKHRDKVWDTLMCLEENGGRDALAMIKLKVPTYNACC